MGDFPLRFSFPTLNITPPIQPLGFKASNQEIPIIIDNGTFNYRAGWGNTETPHINTRNEVRKSKIADPTTGRDSYIGVQFSEEILKLPYRTPFDNGLFINTEVQEEIFDYTFLMLGLSGQSSVTQPIVITEPLCNPNYCRNLMTELLVETYGIESVCYVNDGLSSYYYNQTTHKNQLEDGIAINFGNSSCTVIPIINNNAVFTAAKRIDIGGQHITNYMLNILKQRYSEHKAYLTPWLAQYIKENHTYFPISYLDELTRFEIQSNGELAHIIQLPVPIKAVKVQPTKEELEKKQKERQESGKRLKELMQRKRQEKMDQQTEQLQSMEDLIEIRSKDKEEYKREILTQGYASVKDFEDEYYKIYTSVHKHPPTKNETNLYPLINIPDDQLNADQLVEKKQQLTLKSMNEGRTKALVLKRLQKEKKEQKLKEEEEKRKNDPQGWISDIYKKRNQILDRIEKRKVQPSSSRRNSSSQNRLHLINMASDPKAKDEDFGANDSDWDVYLKMSKGGTDEDDEKDKRELEKLDKLIAKHDPKENDEIPIETYYQFYLGVDRIRVPELIFQPSLIGLDQMGLTEVVNTVFSSFPLQQQQRMEQNIVVTGGSALLPGLKERLDSEIRSIRPTKSKYQVKICSDPLLDAWHGARNFASFGSLSDYSISKKDYSERGLSIKPHFMGNLPY